MDQEIKQALDAMKARITERLAKLEQAFRGSGRGCTERMARRQTSRQSTERIG
jgi:hypothetical protein